MKFFKNKKYIILFLTVAFVSLVTPEIGHAQNFITSWIGDTFTTGLVWFLQFSGTVALFITQWLLVGVAAFLNLVMGMNFMVMDQGFNSIARDGWLIARDIANLGFVLALIIIAVATILRFQEYGAKKMLVRFIAAALIVNFSFVIAGVFVNFSHVVTDFFLNRTTAPAANLDSSLQLNWAGNQEIKMSEMIAGAFNVQRLFMADGNFDFSAEEENDISNLETIIYTLAGMLFSVFFTLLLIVVLIGLGVMFLARYVALTILLILAPLAWLFWVIPSLQGNFTKWWNKFMEWTFFAPAVVFFVYIALAGINSLQLESRDCTGQADATMLECVLGQGVSMFVIGALLLGGLIVAQSLSITFGKESVNAFKGTAAAMRGAVWEKTKSLGRGIKETGKGAANLSTKVGERITGKKYKTPSSKENIKQRKEELQQEMSDMGLDHPDWYAKDKELKDLESQEVGIEKEDKQEKGGSPEEKNMRSRWQKVKAAGKRAGNRSILWQGSKGAIEGLTGKKFKEKKNKERDNMAKKLFGDSYGNLAGWQKSQVDAAMKGEKDKKE